MVRHAGRHIEHDLEVVLRANRTALLSLLWAALLACVVGSLVFDVGHWLGAWWTIRRPQYAARWRLNRDA